MSPLPALERIIADVTRQVRWRRAEHGALRGAFYGAVGAAVVAALRPFLDERALPAAAALFIGGVLAGGVYGYLRRVARLDAARLADRALGLEDRLPTALEWAERPDRTALVPHLVADALEHAERASHLGRTVSRVVPREGRWAPLPLAAAVGLLLLPPLPNPFLHLPDFSRSADDEAPEERTAAALEERARPLTPDPLRRRVFEERDFVPRNAAGASPTAGDVSAVFKDTSLGTQRPDFNSFLKKGDERLKMLEQADRLPDLQSDFTASQYKMLFRKSKSLAGGLRPDQVSPDKLKELLQEMERLGRKGGNWGSDVSEGMEALEGGQTDRAMQAMEKALNKLRAMEERQRDSKSLRGGRDGDRGTRGRERGRDGGSGDGQDLAEGEGSLPGKGRSGSPKGEASQRLQASPYDAGVEGDPRRGRKEGFDTNMSARAGSMQSRLQYLGVLGQYRKMMEDAITREAVPRDYHGQIRDYFQALDDR